jgi:adenylate kinase
MRQLLDSIEDEVKQGGYIIDWHACDLFPKSWIDLVVVLRVDSTLLYDRLKARYVYLESLLPVLEL